MELEHIIESVSHLHEPKSTTEKHKVGKQLEELFHQARANSEVYKWLEGCILYTIQKYGLHNYVYGKASSLNAFYDELGLPPSTAQQRAAMWKFYVVEQKVPLESLYNADIYKLGRAITFLKDKDKKKVAEVVELARRGVMSRYDFLEEIKQ